jgi:hypothetical protein
MKNVFAWILVCMTMLTPETRAENDEIAHPVTFIIPAGDPVDSPVDAGTAPESIPDGANEFTFSAAASGILTIKLKASVTGLGSLSAAEQARYKFEVDSIGDATFAWDNENTGGKGTVSGDTLTATATYTGLPKNNSDFGLKKARVIHDTEKVGEAGFEVFFTRDATNHPQGQTDSANWFYYWQDGQVCGIPSDAIYDDTHPTWSGYTEADKDSILRLCPAAPTAEGYSLTLTSAITKPGSNPPANYGSITVGAGGKGIQCIAVIVSHELYHLTVYADLSDKPDLDVHPTGDDEVGDGVADSSEGSLGGIESSAAHCDTYGISSLGDDYAVYATFGDDEVRARKQESNITFSVLPKKDWANPGCQSVNQFGPQP